MNTITIDRELFASLIYYAVELQGCWEWKRKSTPRFEGEFRQLEEDLDDAARALPDTAVEIRESKTDDSLLITFVQGAAWWEYVSKGATMWTSDRLMAEKEAAKRIANGTIGITPSPDTAVDTQDSPGEQQVGTASTPCSPYNAPHQTPIEPSTP